MTKPSARKPIFAKDVRRRTFLSLFLILLLSFLSPTLSWAVDFPSHQEAVNQETNQKTKEEAKEEIFDTKENPKEDENSPIELTGDSVEFERVGNKLTAKGNVVIIKGNSKLTCDKVEFFKDSQEAKGWGHVILVSPQGTIYSESLIYNFGTMTGEFTQAHFYADPFYGAAKTMSKVGPNHLVLNKGYLTTSDFEKPEYRMTSRKLDVYPGEKVVARNIRMVLGKVPVMYLPRYTQRLDGKPRFTYTPGYNKDWGAFLLTALRFELSENVKGMLHLDLRQKRGNAQGLDLNYKTAKFGSGIWRMYYMDERLKPDGPLLQKYQKKSGNKFPVSYKERYKSEWRHKWDIDAKTQAVWQYYILKDADLLKDYFRNEYNKESNPPSFFLLSRNFPHGSLSLRTDVRVNRFTSGVVERRPEIQYNISNQKIGDTNFYFKTTNTYSNLTKKTFYPNKINLETQRVDTDNQLSYPFKVAFVEFKPYVGGRQTYYTHTHDRSRYHVIRGLFNTGATISTKFFRVFDVKKKFWGVAIERLRHVITPTVAYNYSPNPTIPPSKLDQFDGLDGLIRDHTITFGVENKLQTKREGKSVDLARAIITSPFRLKEYPTGKGSFDHVISKIELKPVDWLKFSLDADYDTTLDHLSTINFDLYINTPEDKWYLFLGKRLNRNVDDQLTTEFGCRLNRKWKFRVYERFDTENSLQKEQGFTVTRDLHSWESDIIFNEKRGEGSEILLVFKIKAFPESTIDIGTSFNRRKTGSQSSTGF